MLSVGRFAQIRQGQSLDSPSAQYITERRKEGNDGYAPMNTTDESRPTMHFEIFIRRLHAASACKELYRPSLSGTYRVCTGCRKIVRSLSRSVRRKSLR